MNQTKELRMSTKGILSLALLLVTVIFVMQKSTLVQASGTTQKVEKNGVWYTLLTETEFKNKYSMDNDDEDASNCLEENKYNNVLAQIQAYGGVYAATGYNGTSSIVSIENTIEGKPVMLVVNLYDDDDDDASNKITSLTIPANVVDFNFSCDEIIIDPNNQYYTAIDGVLYNKAVTEIIDYFNPKAMNGVYNVPENISKIDSYPEDVEIINLPASVVNLPEHNYADSLTAINVAEDNKKFSSVNGVLYNKNKTTLIVYPIAKKDKSYRMPKTVKKINEAVMFNQKYLEKLFFSDKVTVVPAYFGNNMENLKSIHLPKKVKVIGSWAFSNCPKLKKVTVPSTCTAISRAFDSCKSLKTIVIKSKKIKIDRDLIELDMDMIDNDYTTEIKKGSTITLYINDGIHKMKCNQKNIISVKKKKDCVYTIKALNSGKATITCGRKKIKFKVVK